MSAAVAEPITALSVVTPKDNPGSAIISLAEKSGNPMQFLTEMGKQMAASGMLGLKKPEQGSTLLLICITENKKPLDIISEWHLLEDGKMTKKADWVLSRFVEIGGKFRIIKNGSDGEEACYEFSFGGNTETVSYTMDDARREELVKPKSRWVKNPPSMLRARVITNGVRMVAPQVFAGFNTEEEMEGQSGNDSYAEPQKRQAKVTTTAPTTTAAAKTHPPDDAIDAQVEPTSTATAVEKKEEPPFEGGTTPTTTTLENDATAVLMEIELVLGEVGMTKADLVASMKKKRPELNSLDDLTIEQAKGVLEKLRAKKQASQAA